MKIKEFYIMNKHVIVLTLILVITTIAYNLPFLRSLDEQIIRIIVAAWAFTVFIISLFMLQELFSGRTTSEIAMMKEIEERKMRLKVEDRILSFDFEKELNRILRSRFAKSLNTFRLNGILAIICLIACALSFFYSSQIYVKFILIFSCVACLVSLWISVTCYRTVKSSLRAINLNGKQ